MNTVQIKVARNSDSYSPADIAGLKKLAADNPNITQLKEFRGQQGLGTRRIGTRIKT